MAFIYQSYNYKINQKELKISFNFLIKPNIKFKPIISIPLSKTLKDSDNLKNLIFNLGMMELISYWKLTCEKEIIVNCGYLNREQIKFFNKLYLNGLGEFFYQNKLPFLNQK